MRCGTCKRALFFHAYKVGDTVYCPVCYRVAAHENPTKRVSFAIQLFNLTGFLCMASGLFFISAAMSSARIITLILLFAGGILSLIVGQKQGKKKGVIQYSGVPGVLPIYIKEYAYFHGL